MLIEVTKKHIKDAHTACFLDSCESLTHCMVATALKDIFPGKDIEVAYFHAYIDNKHIALPESVSEKIFVFMGGEMPEEFSFELDYIAP